MENNVRLRTADQVYDEIREMDPNTAITRHYIRKIIAEEKIRVVHVGRKSLVNMQDVLAYFEGN